MYWLGNYWEIMIFLLKINFNIHKIYYNAFQIITSLKYLSLALHRHYILLLDLFEKQINDQIKIKFVGPKGQYLYIWITTLCSIYLYCNCCSIVSTLILSARFTKRNHWNVRYVDFTCEMHCIYALVCVFFWFCIACEHIEILAGADDSFSL